MRFIKFILLFFLTFSALSCSTEDETGTLDGTWRLKNASVTEGANIEYTEGAVSWTFDPHTRRLTVQNNIMNLGPENIFAGLESGTYNYTISAQGNTKTLYVEGIEQGIFAYTTENLVINSDANANGVIKIFGR